MFNWTLPIWAAGTNAAQEYSRSWFPAPLSAARFGLLSMSAQPCGCTWPVSGHGHTSEPAKVSACAPPNPNDGWVRVSSAKEKHKYTDSRKIRCLQAFPECAALFRGRCRERGAEFSPYLYTSSWETETASRMAAKGKWHWCCTNPRENSFPWFPWMLYQCWVYTAGCWAASGTSGKDWSDMLADMKQMKQLQTTSSFLLLDSWKFFDRLFSHCFGKGKDFTFLTFPVKWKNTFPFSSVS